MSASVFHIMCVSIALIIISFGTVQADVTLYSTDFSNASEWETNSPASFFLDEKTGRYHYLIAGGTGSYVKNPLPEALTGPFTLEFDVYPVKTEEKSSFRFGIGSEEADSQKGPLVLAELNNQNGEQSFSLTGISQENLRSQTFSIPGKGNYSGKTIKFSDGEEYHVRITWYPVEKRVSMTVTTPGDETPLFSHFILVSGKMEDFSHLFMTSIGEGQNDRKAEGFIDNIRLTSLSSVPGTVEPVSTPEEEAPEPTIVASGPIVTPEPESLSGDEDEPETDEPVPTRTPLPKPPTPVPTEKAGVLPLAGVLGTIVAIIILRR